jgi:hypothetical protein
MIISLAGAFAPSLIILGVEVHCGGEPLLFAFGLLL